MLKRPRPLIGVDVDDVIVDFVRPFLWFCKHRHQIDVRYEDCHDHNLATVMDLSTEQFQELLTEYEDTFDQEYPLLVEGATPRIGELYDYFDLVAITSRRGRFLIEATKRFFARELPFIELYFANGRNNPLGTIKGRPGKVQLAETLGLVALIEDNPAEVEHVVGYTSVEMVVLAQPWNKKLVKPHPEVFRGNWGDVRDHLIGEYAS